MNKYKYFKFNVVYPDSENYDEHYRVSPNNTFEYRSIKTKNKWIKYSHLSWTDYLSRYDYNNEIHPMTDKEAFIEFL